jgi:hypothetical protein
MRLNIWRQADGAEGRTESVTMDTRNWRKGRGDLQGNRARLSRAAGAGTSVKRISTTICIDD